MHFIITDASLARSRAIHLSGTSLALAAVGLSLVLMLMAAGFYHWVIVKGAREHWPVVGTLVRLVDRDQLEQRDRFMRENLDAMARKLGDMQARMLQLEALGERVGGLAGINPAELKVDPNPGRGGALVEGRPLSLPELQGMVDALDQATDSRADLFTVMESRLVEQRLKKMMVPTQNPANGAPVGSRFGYRIDPFTGRSALHTGLDFRAMYGTPIVAAAGGVVVTAMMHPEYGNMVEVDHGNGLVTRYGHASRLLVKKGDLVKRGQQLALVGSTGRSTGAHLHFEVLVQGVQQDPQKFLAGGATADHLVAEFTSPNAKAH
jgi:murein DD-endopeptidase MepM/ murein hydrolase activator NlpD